MKISTLVALGLASSSVVAHAGEASSHDSLTLQIDGITYTFAVDHANAQIVAADRAITPEQAKVGLDACLSLLR
jgi:hypothetical protein